MTTAQKLKVKEGNAIVVINAPPDYKKSLGSLPPGAKITGTGNLLTRRIGL